MTFEVDPKTLFPFINQMFFKWCTLCFGTLLHLVTV